MPGSIELLGIAFTYSSFIHLLWIQNTLGGKKNINVAFDKKTGAVSISLTKGAKKSNGPANSPFALFLFPVQDRYWVFCLPVQSMMVHGHSRLACLVYNGNITGMVWRSKGDLENRKYDFTYGHGRTWGRELNGKKVLLNEKLFTD